MSSAPRVQRAATRYRPGKAPAGANQQPLDSDSDESESELQPRQKQKQPPKEEEVDLSTGIKALQDRQQRRTAGIVIQQGASLPSLKNVQVGKKEEVEESSDEYETDTDEEEPPKPVFRPKAAAAGVAAPLPGTAGAAQKEESSEYETDSEEEESSEEQAPKPLLKPMFQSKKQRESSAPKAAEVGGIDTKTAAGAGADGDDEEAKARAQAEARRKESHNLAAERIKREVLETAAAKEAQTDVDDTDGLDPDAEFQAWRIRELERIKRDREAASAREEEREEIERRRAMPEARRLQEDMEHAKKTRDEKVRGNAGFMQKYYHKGSFFQDLDILKKRDYTEATEGAVDKSLLPKVMQVRDYGKASRSKWTHLANEDTSRRQEDPRWKGMSRRDEEGRDGSQRRRDETKTGANRADIRRGEQRQWGGERRRSRSPDRSRRREDESRR